MCVYVCIRVCTCMYPEARYNWKLTPSTSSLFFFLLFNNYTSRRASEDTMRILANIPYLLLAMPREILEMRHLNTFTIWLNTSVIFLSDARSTLPHPLNHTRDFRDAKSFGFPFERNPLLLYITAQLYTRVCTILCLANAAVNIGDMSPIRRKTYCRPTTLQSKWKAKACSPEYVNVKCLAFSCRNQKRRISYVQFLYVECG